jgi:hypothetical protein
VITPERVPSDPSLAPDPSTPEREHRAAVYYETQDFMYGVTKTLMWVACIMTILTGSMFGNTIHTWWGAVYSFAGVMVLPMTFCAVQRMQTHFYFPLQQPTDDVSMKYNKWIGIPFVVATVASLGLFMWEYILVTQRLDKLQYAPQSYFDPMSSGTAIGVCIMLCIMLGLTIEGLISRLRAPVYPLHPTTDE